MSNLTGAYLISKAYNLTNPTHNYGHYCKSLKDNGLCILVKDIDGRWHDFHTDNIYYNWHERCLFRHPKPYDQVLRPHIICKTAWIDENAKEAWEMADKEK